MNCQSCSTSAPKMLSCPVCGAPTCYNCRDERDRCPECVRKAAEQAWLRKWHEASEGVGT